MKPMKYLDFILQQYLQSSNKYFKQNKKSPLFKDGNTREKTPKDS